MGVGAVDGASGVILAAERVLFAFGVSILNESMDRRSRTGRESSPFTSGFDIFTSEYALSDN